jgi:thiol-disulfide isomerase/thioredoxin
MMLERALIALVLLAVGFLAYRLWSRYHLQWAAANTTGDPILRDLKPGVPAIIYFTTPTCIPCRTQQRPALARLRDDLGEHIQIVEIDATQHPDAADRWGVFSAPTTFILDARHQLREANYGVADAAKLQRQLELARAST